MAGSKARPGRGVLRAPAEGARHNMMSVFELFEEDQYKVSGASFRKRMSGRGRVRPSTGHCSAHARRAPAFVSSLRSLTKA